MVSRLLCTVLACLVLAQQALADLGDEFRDINEQLLHDASGHLADGGQVYQPGLMSLLYDSTDYRPLWADRGQVLEVLGILRDSELEGLDPADYHHPELLALMEEHEQLFADRDRIRARFDVLLTDGLLLYFRHLLEGKVDPRLLDPSFNNARRDFVPADMVRNQRRAIEQDQVAERLEAVELLRHFPTMESRLELQELLRGRGFLWMSKEPQALRAAVRAVLAEHRG